MELSEEMLQRVIRAMKMESGFGPAERRSKFRIGLHYRARIIPFVGGIFKPSIIVPVRDISQSGIGVICSKHMRTGTRFVICLPREGGKRLLLVCVIKNCREVARHGFAIGAGFSQLVETEWTNPMPKLGPSSEGRPTRRGSSLTQVIPQWNIG